MSGKLSMEHFVYVERVSLRFRVCVKTAQTIFAFQLHLFRIKLRYCFTQRFDHYQLESKPDCIEFQSSYQSPGLTL